MIQTHDFLPVIEYMINGYRALYRSEQISVDVHIVRWLERERKRIKIVWNRYLRHTMVDARERNRIQSKLRQLDTTATSLRLSLLNWEIRRWQKDFYEYASNQPLLHGRSASR